MMETELTSQTDTSADSSSNQFRKDVILSKYAKIQTNEELFIDPKDIQLGVSTEDMISGSLAPINTEDLSGPISIEAPKKYFFKKIGKCFSFLGDRKGDPLLIVGPCWIKFVVILLTTTIFYFYICNKKWENLGGFMKFMGIIIYLTYFASHSYTELINPGYPKHDLDSKTGEPRSRYEYCPICRMWVSKEKKTKHCVQCDICVEGHSKHYKWMSKCIGKNNKMFYYIFLGSLGFTILFSLCILATKSKQVQNTNIEK